MNTFLESEAKQKQCYRGMGETRDVYCMGSSCMAWRWEQDVERKWFAQGEVAPEGFEDKREFVRDFSQRNAETGLMGVPTEKRVGGYCARQIPESERQGYCGASEAKIAEVEISS